MSVSQNSNDKQMKVENDLVAFAKDVRDKIDTKQHELDRRHNNSEKSTRKLLTTLNKSDAVLTQKQEQLTVVQTRVHTLETSITTELAKLDKIDWGEDEEVDLSQNGMENALDSLETGLVTLQKKPATLGELKKIYEGFISKFGENNTCKCCNRGCEDDAEAAEVLQHMTKAKEKVDNWIKVYTENDARDNLDEARRQLSVFKQIKDQSWQPWKIQKNSITKLEHEVKTQKAEQEKASTKWEASNKETQDYNAQLETINQHQNNCHSLNNHIKNTEGIMSQVKRMRDQMPVESSSSSSSSSSAAISANMNEYTTLESVERALDQIEKDRNEVADSLVELDRLLDAGMRKGKCSLGSLCSLCSLCSVYSHAM